jgi:hypothetical protein
MVDASLAFSCCEAFLMKKGSASTEVRLRPVQHPVQLRRLG